MPVGALLGPEPPPGEDSSASGATISISMPSSASAAAASARGSRSRPATAAPAACSAGAAISACASQPSAASLSSVRHASPFSRSRSWVRRGRSPTGSEVARPYSVGPDAQRDRAAATRAVDPVGLRVGALDRLQPRDRCDLGVGQPHRFLDVGELVGGLAQEELLRGVAQQRPAVRSGEVRELLADRDQEQPEVARAAGDLVDPLAGRASLDELPRLVDDEHRASCEDAGVGLP